MADLSITPANVLKVSGSVAHVTAGATVTAGQIVTKQVDGKYDPAIIDGTDSPTDYTTGVNAIFGVALHGASDGQPLEIQISGVITAGTAAEGIIYVCSAAVDGSLAPYADLVGGDNDVVTIVGVGNNANNIELVLFASGENI